MPINKLTITFPSLPPAELMANSARRIHWSVKSPISAAARGEGKIMGIVALQKTPGWAAPELAELSFLFAFPDKRIHDLDGLLTACKPWIDGIVDAGVILADDCWHLYIGRARPVLWTGYYTVLTFRRVK